MSTEARTSVEPVVQFADELADKLLHCSRYFNQHAMTFEQRACAEACKLLSQQARELVQARSRSTHEWWP